MKTPPQPKAPRARAMWLNRTELTEEPMEATGTVAGDFIGEPVSVLPRSKEAQEQLIEQGAAAVFRLRFPKESFKKWRHGAIADECVAQARAALQDSREGK